MNRYGLQNVIAFLLIFIGWLVALGGSTLCIIYISKPSMLSHLGFLPKALLQKIGSTPDWLFFTPVGVCVLLGLLIVGIGHILQVCIENARNSYETVEMLDMIRVRTAPY
jgi:hypothetical protein